MNDSEYPAHIPPQHAPRNQRRRKAAPPASVSKLHRPLVSYANIQTNDSSNRKRRKITNKNTNPKTRFYCNDCKKKFRSRILANRNNNAVQHYCSLYLKIITRKVDSHSNKCKGDHGMGACVVRRTDSDPDSDGEDETKAAYYADKGKTRPTTRRKSSGAYVKVKKRKRKENDNDNNDDNTPKRQRIDTTNIPPQTMYYPPLPGGYNGYYNGNGYMNGQNGYNGYNNSPPLPPIENGNSSPLYGDMNMNNMNIMTGRDNINNNIDNMVLPPPPLEEIEPMQIQAETQIIPPVMVTGNGNDSNELGDVFVEVNDNVAGNMIGDGNVNGNTNTNANGTGDVEINDKEIIEDESKENNSVVNGKIDEDDSGECINDENTEEDEDLPDLNVPNGEVNDNNQQDQDDDLILELPQ